MTDKESTTLKNRIHAGSELSEFNDEELADLTPAEIERYIDLECARRGLPLLPQDPGPAPAKPKIEMDTKVYEVQLGYSTVLTMIDQGAALELVDALNKAIQAGAVTTASISRSYGERDLGDCISGTEARTPEIKTKPAASANAKASVDAEVQDYERQADRWKELDTEFGKARNARQETRDWVYDEVNEAEKRIRAKQRAQNRLDRYIDLAGGDRRMGVIFLEAHDNEAGKETGDIELLGLQEEIESYTTKVDMVELAAGAVGIDMTGVRAVDENGVPLEWEDPEGPEPEEEA